MPKYWHFGPKTFRELAARLMEADAAYFVVRPSGEKLYLSVYTAQGKPIGSPIELNESENCPPFCLTFPVG